MNFKTICTTILLAQWLAFASFAQVPSATPSVVELRSVAREKSAASHNSPAAAIRKSDAAAVPAAVNSEVFRSIYLGLGKSLALESDMDYSSAGTVAVGFQCIICDTSATSLSNSGLIIQAQWVVPNAGLYVTTENKAATTFVYWDSGGVIFNVYGSQLRLVLQNKGKEPISIEQVTVLRRAN